MKRILPILFLLALLCGCASAPEEQQQESTTQPTQAAVIHTYTADSEVEKQTNGAVRQYRIDDEKLDWIAPFNGGILAASAGQQTKLYVLSGLDGQITATATVPEKLANTSIWQTTSGGFIYYAFAEKQMVFLDASLKEVKRLQLPDTLSGTPAIAPNGSEIFFCEGQTVNAMDTERKIVRPVRTNTCEEQTMLGCYLEGTVVACKIRDAQDQWSTLYISGEDGRLLHKENGLQQVYSRGNAYFVLRADGATNQYIYGSTDAAPLQLNIPDTTAYGVPELDGVVGKTVTAEGFLLNFYNMKKTAVVTVPQNPVMAVADSAEQGVWLLTEDGALLRWSLAASAVEENIDYAGTVYTAQAPDAEGLVQCAQRGDAIGKEFGVVIRVYQRALVSNYDYDIEVEYQTHAINRALDGLETLLRKFPPKFLDKSIAGQIRICIVRSIGGEVTNAFHWYDGDPFIILSAGMDIEQAFMESFAHILESHVLGNSSLMDQWESLNPEGFAYGAETTVMAYLEGENRAFADRKGMRSVTDDRTSVFYQAVLADNADVFQSEIMQSKLKLLCQAIRNAGRLETSAETFLWEQYLTEPLV